MLIGTVPSNLRFLKGRSTSGFSSSLDSPPSSSCACAPASLPGLGFPFAFFAASLRFCRFARFFAVFASAASSRSRFRCSNSAASTSYKRANHIYQLVFYGRAYNTVGSSTHLLGLLIHQLQALILASSIRLVNVKLAATSTCRAPLHVLHHLPRRSDGFFFWRCGKNDRLGRVLEELLQLHSLFLNSSQGMFVGRCLGARCWKWTRRLGHGWVRRSCRAKTCKLSHCRTTLLGISFPMSYYTVPFYVYCSTTAVCDVESVEISAKLSTTKNIVEVLVFSS